MHGNMSKDKKTCLRLALNLHVLYFVLGEELEGRIPTTVLMVISKETMARTVELTKYFAAQRGVYELKRYDETRSFLNSIKYFYINNFLIKI